MTITEQNFLETLKRTEKGAIIYTYRGGIERGVGGRYVWQDGYSASTKDGGVLYPWMNKRDCYRDAKRFGCKAAFENTNGVPFAG